MEKQSIKHEKWPERYKNCHEDMKNNQNDLKTVQKIINNSHKGMKIKHINTLKMATKR